MPPMINILIGRQMPSRTEEAVYALKQIMRDAEGNRAVLLAYVLGGRRKFVNEVSKELRGMAVTEDMLTKVWLWMFHRRGPDPQHEFESLCEQAYNRQLQQEAEQTALNVLHDKARRRMD